MLRNRLSSYAMRAKTRIPITEPCDVSPPRLMRLSGHTHATNRRCLKGNTRYSRKLGKSNSVRSTHTCVLDGLLEIGRALGECCDLGPEPICLAHLLRQRRRRLLRCRLVLLTARLRGGQQTRRGAAQHNNAHAVSDSRAPSGHDGNSNPRCVLSHSACTRDTGHNENKGERAHREPSKASAFVQTLYSSRAARDSRASLSCLSSSAFSAACRVASASNDVSRDWFACCVCLGWPRGGTKDDVCVRSD